MWPMFLLERVSQCSARPRVCKCEAWPRVVHVSSQTNMVEKSACRLLANLHEASARATDVARAAADARTEDEARRRRGVHALR